jgi:TolB-like protein/Flp pilus assembly protein TadD
MALYGLRSTTMPGADSHETFRFRDFELDPTEYELRRRGCHVRLERQPMDVLILLVERRGQLVSRSDLIDRLWGKDVFVDVETGVNTAIRKVRQALGDLPEAPAYIETVSGRGYRFKAAVEVVPALGSGPSRMMLAVLPFENLGSDSEREYLADGLTEETIASLGQIDPERLSVIGRTSTMAYKGTRKSLAAIGQELSVDYLVEGSIRAEAARLRITSRLSRVRDQVQVWSASYDREPPSLLGLQRELSTTIAEQIRLRLSPERLHALALRQTQNAAAYDLYLRGRRLWNQLTADTTRRAVDYYERATALDPGYALAWAGVADAYSSSPVNADAPPHAVLPRARAAAAQAIRAEPSLAEAHVSTALVRFWLDWDWPPAEAGLRRAIAFDPSHVWAHIMFGHVLSQEGRHDEAKPALRRARELDPLSALTHAISSQVAFQARDYSAAAEHASRAIVVDPDFWVGYMMSGQAYEPLGRSDLALEALAKAARLSAGNSKPISLRGYILAKSGQSSQARELLGVLEEVARQRYVPPYAAALVHAGLGDHDRVFEWLDKAYAARDVHLVFLIVDSKWDAYRADPRFAALLARCGFTPRPAAGLPGPVSGGPGPGGQANGR